jgi:hypothetical protein
MARLTKRKALQVCYELWMWWYENPQKEKSDWPRYHEYEFDNDCPCCEYNKQHNNDSFSVTSNKCCLKCPLLSFWKNYNNVNRIPCLTGLYDPGNSPFSTILETGNLKIRKENILLIANAAKAELDKLPPLKKKG